MNKPTPDADRVSKAGDPTPEMGAKTDVAWLGHGGPIPAHELTADQGADVADWEPVAETAGFKELLRAKARFIVPATIFFLVYEFQAARQSTQQVRRLVPP